MKSDTLVKGKKVLDDIHKMRNIGELMDYIPQKTIQRIAFAILIIWTTSPIITMVYGSFARLDDVHDWVNQLNQMNKMTINWYRILLQLGFLSCFLGLITFIKNLRNARKDQFHKKIYIKERIIPICLFLMLIWSFLFFLFSGDVSVSVVGSDYKKEGFLTYIAVAGMFSSGYIIKDRKYMIWTMEFYTAVALIQSILILINVDGINKQLGLTENASVYLNINHFAYYLCMAAMSALLLYENEKSKWRSFIRLLTFALIIATLVKNKSFGPYLATLSAIISSIILAIWLNKGRLRRLVIALVVFILITFIMNISDGHLYIDLRIFGIELFKIIEGSEDLSAIGSGRWELWRTGFQLIAKKPIFGSGPALLSDIYAEVLGRANRPHNEFIEHAATIGIPGLLFYISALLIYLKEFIKKRREASTYSIGLLCILIAYLVSSLFGVTMYNTSPIFFMFFGLSVAQLKSVPGTVPGTKTVGTRYGTWYRRGGKLYCGESNNYIYYREDFSYEICILSSLW